MNDNLTAYAETNVAFRKAISERLKAISELIKQLNLADVGKNRADLKKANEELEATRKQLAEKQGQLEQTQVALAQVQKDLADANASTQAVNAQMKALQEESDKKMNDLTQQHAQELEALKRQNEEQLVASQSATQAEKDKILADNEEKLKAIEARFKEEKDAMQAQLESEKQAMQAQMKEAQDAQKRAEENLTALQASQEAIQVGLNEINQLIENQLQIIQRVVDSEPSNNELNDVVSTINQNLTLAMQMLTQTQSQSQNQFPSVTPSNLVDVYNTLSEEEKNKLFPALQDRANFEGRLEVAQREQNTNPAAFTRAMSKLAYEYRQRANAKTGGRRRKHIVTKHTAKKRFIVPRLSGKPPSAWRESVINPTKTMRKTRKVKRQRQQKGGYIYKENDSLRKRSSIVDEKRTSSTHTKRTSHRHSSRRTKKRT